MKALTYHGSKDVRVETVPDPTLVEADDILLRVTATAICGSDLHLFHGKIPETRHGDIFGHEFMGVVEDAGPAVTEVSVGDRVVIPFVIACGKCFFCENELFSACETTNPDQGASVRKRAKMTPPAALFGYSHLYGGVPGGQAEYVRVPKANVGPFAVPGSLADEKVLFLSDILPTGYQAVLNAKIGPGSTVAIFGAGPVGLMAAACARMLGAEQIFMVDSERYRLDFAVGAYGVIPIDFSEGDASERILELTNGRGVSASIDAVGFEAKGSTTETVLSTLKIETSSGEVIRQCISATQRGGVVSIPGVYAGFIHGFLIGDAFDKGLSFAMGQTHVHKYLPELLGFIEDGDLDPDIIISHRMKLADAAQGYKIFDEKQENCRKVVMTP
ncbi:zinc-dependent alcohol dehydrogenase [Pseudoxanthomonas winnipegensis]|jgi:threonine dehydrogenase-like Zn-dependent dehydrogenase|uniref:Glutathione-dependent formaldehyde dehydrogenase n=1 Tax=Pseudoxanthomonas winnipegensis TaxID=2480810 RepID=A0A4Q8L724_9GAMM|nr:zinc-dependent alcohol dehydrogenase [Pseudoxanthomonas winnipegensis]PZP63135.1 MAG: glutathione-dependent formaldehyde dehydrogenase [Pseudoxanthomonas spadix]TAA23758.1 glutathione-dependent formaldehyde dehydrogenase [Pseudoxanthomonas winnipegensis]